MSLPHIPSGCLVSLGAVSATESVRVHSALPFRPLRQSSAITLVGMRGDRRLELAILSESLDAD